MTKLLKSLCIILIVFVYFSPVVVFADNEAQQIHKKFLTNIEKMNNELNNNQTPTPLLSNEETLQLVKTARKNLNLGDDYTDLQIANLIGVMGGIQYIGMGLKKAFSE